MWGWETAERRLAAAGYSHVERHRLPHDPMNVWFVSHRQPNECSRATTTLLPRRPPHHGKSVLHARQFEVSITPQAIGGPDCPEGCACLPASRPLWMTMARLTNESLSPGFKLALGMVSSSRPLP